MIETTKPVEIIQPQVSPTPSQHQPQSRLDPITQQWSIFAPGRVERPEEILSETEKVDQTVRCPFCADHEDQTPPPVWIGRLPGTQNDWSVRVVPNKYPAVETAHTKSKAVQNDLFQQQIVRGGHEVFVESRQHIQSIADLDLAEVLLLFQAYQDRLNHWRKVDGIEYISLFKNVGAKAGASLCHSHSQLIATDRLPAQTLDAFENVNRHRQKTGCCLQCDLIRAELKAKKRIVWNDGISVAFCPFASRLPMMLRITSAEHQACFEELDQTTLQSVSRLVHRSVSWLEKLRPGTAYNYCLNTRPPGITDTADAFHWSVDLFPRMNQVAGFEWSSGCMINPILPETAAAKYRSIAKSEDPRSALSS